MVNTHLAWCLNSDLNVKALVGAFNQEKALVGAFSLIIQPVVVVEPMEHYTALVFRVSESGRRGDKFRVNFLNILCSSAAARSSSSEYKQFIQEEEIQI